jgi:hypothetical protein
MDSRLEFFEREIAHRSMHPWFCRNERCQMKPGRVDMEIQAIAHPSVSVASSSFVGPSVLAHFHLQTVVDEVKSSWTKAYCTLHLVKCYASLRHEQHGFGFLSLVEGISSEDWCLRLSV